MTFRFAGSRAQVCRHCKFVVARTDRDLVAVGKVADLVDIPTPLQLGATGRWGNEPFAVEGRAQLDRASAPGAPWQEIFISFPASGKWCWIASAQGRFYSTSEVPLPPGALPPFASLRPGIAVQLGPHGAWQVAEVGRRRLVSGEGELPDVAPPGVATAFADIAGPNGAFGTIDYGDGGAIPAKLYLGRQIDPAALQLDSGAPIEQPEAAVTTLACPNCGGNLPIVTPGSTERVVCRYCGMASDLRQGALVALQPAPKPPKEPYIPLGAEGTVRGHRVICIGYVIRGCTVSGERYRWREYLLYAGPRVGYLWLMEEDGAWQLVTPIPPGAVTVAGGACHYRGHSYRLLQSVGADVEYVIGEFYWKVEIGEHVRASEYTGPGGKVSVEEAPTEVTYSFCEPIAGAELASAFNLRSVAAIPAASYGTSGTQNPVVTLLVIGVILFLIFGLATCGSCVGGGGGFGGPSVGGPSFGGK
jgi:hypothetical protein